MKQASLSLTNTSDKIMWLLLPLSLCLLMISPSSLRAQVHPLRLPLSGMWLFKADPGKVGMREGWFADTTLESGWQPVQVPSFWEKYPGLETYDGWGWFARTVTIENVSEPMSLHFGGIDDEATVWVNGVEVGSHSGYSEPFAMDVTGALKSGENQIVILVTDDGGPGGIFKEVTLVATRGLDELFKSSYFGTPALRSADWVKEAVIYSVYLRSFSKEGTFEGLEKRLPELKDMGVTVLWLMPIHPVGVKNRKGKLGSPYSVQDYYAVNPEFGTMQDFKRLLAAVHRGGMKLIIDLVANHTSWDSKLITEHPGWFTKDSKGNIVSPNPDWSDVADLDYAQPGLRKYMIDMMRWWVKDIGIDGFRCDVAELVPTDFWEEARDRLNKIKPVMMLAEGSIPEEHVKAFDLTYAWNVYDALDPLLKGKRPASALDEILKMEQLQYPVGSLRMRFNTNHDKNNSDGPAVVRYGKDGLKLTSVLINTIPGVPMIYTGEEVANDRKLSLFEKVDVDWRRAREMGRLYRTLFLLRRNHKALTRGELIKVNCSTPKDVYAFFRAAGSDRILTVLNFAAEARSDTLTIPMEKLFPGEKRVLMKEVFSGKRLEVHPEEQGRVEIGLEPRGYAVYTVEKK